MSPAAQGVREHPAPRRLELDLTSPEPIPEAGIARADELMRTGRLFRYAETGVGDGDDAAILEERMADLVGRRYAVAVNSCGSAMFLALRSVGVRPGDRVLVNGYTLAPVPGAIDHAGAVPVLVEITEDLTVDLTDLRGKAESSGATVLLLSHMRGHLADLDEVSALCEELGLVLIEDCAHTLGARWSGRSAGTFGRIGCFSAQTFKHLNTGEGGFLVTDDDDVAARAILHSGSYMLYGQHRARPPLHVFEPLRGRVANYSLRLSALAAAVALPQLDLLPERIATMNDRYRSLEALLSAVREVRLVRRDPREEFVGSSCQFTLPGFGPDRIRRFTEVANDYGLHVKWFGESRMLGFTSRPGQWEYVEPAQQLPRTEAILSKLCEIRVPPGMQPDHCHLAAEIIRFAAHTAASVIGPGPD